MGKPFVVPSFPIGKIDDLKNRVNTLEAAGGGDVTKVGTPADNQVGVWTGDGTIEGTAGLTYNGTALGLTGNITVSGTVDGRDIATDGTKLDGIEALADVTDATNVDAAGAVMNSDASTASMSFVIDEDSMATNSATKVPTQQSVKAYVDAQAGSSVTEAFVIAMASAL